MVHQMEDAPGWVNHPAPHGTLEEFLAVRLILDEAACRFVASENGVQLDATDRREDRRSPDGDTFADQDLQIAFDIFQWSQLMGWSPSTLRSLANFDALIEEIESFDSIARRRLFQEAYERNYQHGILDAIAGALPAVAAFPAGNDPVVGLDLSISFQLCCCIDDREESFRRHLEEIDPKCETFGAAGFFAVAMNYKGVTEARYKPLCPAVITPTHYVRENVGYTFTGDHRRRSEARKTLGKLTHQVHTGSRSFFGGVVTSVLGSLAAFPLVTRVLFPRLTSRLRRKAGRFLGPPPVTQLQLERHKEPPGGHDGQIGYSLDEMTAIVKRLLEDIGLTTGFSRLMVMTGHGSSSINNPHMSAYNCVRVRVSVVVRTLARLPRWQMTSVFGVNCLIWESLFPMTLGSWVPTTTLVTKVLSGTTSIVYHRSTFKILKRPRRLSIRQFCETRKNAADDLKQPR